MARIMIVDDEELVRYALREILEDEGYEIIEACNGAQCIERHSESPADLIITDILMPDKEGFETIKELRESKTDVPIIAISGGGLRPGTSSMFLKMAELLGANRILKKPVEKDELLEIVDACLRSPA